MSTFGDIGSALISAFLAFAWARLCFGAWTFRTTETTEEDS